MVRSLHTPVSVRLIQKPTSSTPHPVSVLVLFGLELRCIPSQHVQRSFREHELVEAVVLHLQDPIS